MLTFYSSCHFSFSLKVKGIQYELTFAGTVIILFEIVSVLTAMNKRLINVCSFGLQGASAPAAPLPRVHPVYVE